MYVISRVLSSLRCNICTISEMYRMQQEKEFLHTSCELGACYECSMSTFLFWKSRHGQTVTLSVQISANPTEAPVAADLGSLWNVSTPPWRTVHVWAQFFLKRWKLLLPQRWATERVGGLWGERHMTPTHTHTRKNERENVVIAAKHEQGLGLPHFFAILWDFCFVENSSFL